MSNRASDPQFVLAHGRKSADWPGETRVCHTREEEANTPLPALLELIAALSWTFHDWGEKTANGETEEQGALNSSSYLSFTAWRIEHHDKRTDKAATEPEPALACMGGGGG
jgi:hypothetical protein